KIGADYIALSYHAAFGTPVAVIRPFNTYGPRQSARAVIPTIISQIATGSRQIRLGALSPTRDFSYVADTVEGFVKAITSDAVVGGVTNLGSGFEISVGDTAGLIAELMDAEIEIVCEADRVRPKDSEVERLLSSNALARERMQWSPALSGIDGFRQGLAKT